MSALKTNQSYTTKLKYEVLVLSDRLSKLEARFKVLEEKYNLLKYQLSKRG